MSNKELWTKTNQELIVGEKKGNGIGLYRHCEEMTSALSNKHCVTRPQKKTATMEHLEKRNGVRNVSDKA